MSTLISGRLKWILRVAISLLVISFWGAYLWRNWDGFLSYRWQLDFSWLLLDLLAAIAFWASLPLLWQRVLASMGGSLPVGSAVQLWTTSMLGRYLPGGVWHIAGRVFMAEKAGSSRMVVFLSTVAEQVLTLLGVFFLLVATLPFWSPDYSNLAPIFVLALPLAIVVHPAIFGRLASLAVRFSSKGKLSATGVHTSELSGESEHLVLLGRGAPAGVPCGLLCGQSSRCAARLPFGSGNRTSIPRLAACFHRGLRHKLCGGILQFLRAKRPWCTRRGYCAAIDASCRSSGSFGRQRS